ncbi:MAG TPA: SRPBCC family protein [Noviherbaspirillum sp.]|uniref:SRPBCC family protein n=1 Tax=Noviherbaspirillum sp. TaxID=1926288 RepID=UPI002D28677E|nr:SRPBCC family protein [Noviherbaspirillum sp.]HYD94985.1 SRPBCC family protein [Noviherbaspirillum sp.]
MATVQQSIDLKVPVHTAYNQLTQFEDYPRFMDEVETVQQIDDTHLHWTTVMSNRTVEWDAEITEQQPDRCIAWHNTSGPTNVGKVEVQPLGEDSSRVTFTLQAEPQQVPGSSAGNSEQELAQRLKMDLARLKDFIEARGAETGAWRGEVHGAQVTGEAPQQQAAMQAEPRSAPTPTSSFAAGSEGWSGEEDPDEPVVSASQMAAAQRNDSAGSVSQGQPAPSAGGQEQSGGNGRMQQDTAQAQPAPETAPNRQPGLGNTAAAVGAAGGTDAAAGAQQSGSKGVSSTPGLRQLTDAEGVPGTPGGSVQGDSVTPAAGANAAGGTGLGSTASADDTRTGTGTASGSGTALTGGGASGGRDAGKGS